MIECRNHRMHGADADTPERVNDSQSIPQLTTQDDLIRFLCIPEISEAKDQQNVIERLKRYRDLPRIRLCNKTLYPLRAILEWIERQTVNGK